MKITRLAAALCALAVFTCAAHAAQPSTTAAVTGAGALLGGSVNLTWGAYVQAFLSWAQDIAVTAAGTAVAAFIGFAVKEKMPAFLVGMLRDYLTQARIQRAVAWGTTQIDGAVKGKSLDLPAANGLAAMAESYMLSYAPQIAEQLGAKLKPVILAEIAKLGMAPSEAMSSPLPSKPIPQTFK